MSIFAAVPPLEPELERARAALFMDLRQRLGNGVVLDAMETVRRDLMVPDEYRDRSYDDTSLPIERRQTISQPRIVAEMTSALRLSPSDIVLDVGTGSGYQAAIASLLADSVVSVELVPEIADRAACRLQWLGYHNVKVHRVDRASDILGRPQESPYDGIVVAAAAPSIPDSLVSQLREFGRMVIPVGGRDHQALTCVTRTPHGLEIQDLGPCQFVPLLGHEAW
ncbi:MAG: protein-L-isoaspartate(D-aspartate) O-methyltransferase [Chloroflexi bacterium]|nr:protein-L-isoaspartate(D-aspartate) O-methyltransferase [Chloroflexota bacterium]